MVRVHMSVRRSLSVIIAVHILLALVSSWVIFPVLSRDSGREIVYDEFDAIAWNLTQGKGFRADHGEETVVRGPVYPLFLAAIYHVAGGRAFWAVQLVQALLGGLTVWLTFILARRLFEERVALLAALFMALHPLLLWFSSRIYIESFATALFLSACVLIDRFIVRRTWPMALAAAAGIALCMLTKQVFVIMLPVVFVLLVGARAGIIRAAAWTALIGALSAALIAPWSMRNYQVSGQFVPVHATLGFSLLAGHYSAAMLGESPLSFLPANDRAIAMFDDVTLEEGLPPAHWPYRSQREELDVDRAALRHFVKLYGGDPIQFAIISSIRFAQFWYLAATPLASAVMLALTLVSFYLSFIACLTRRFAYSLLFPVAFLSVFAAAHALIIGWARYSIPVQPLLMILAAVGLLDLLGRRVKTGEEESV